jgi:hypothetical protein
MWNLSNKIAAFGARSDSPERLPHVHDRQAYGLAVLRTEPVVKRGRAGLGAIGAGKPDRSATVPGGFTSSSFEVRVSGRVGLKLPNALTRGAPIKPWLNASGASRAIGSSLRG